MNERVEIYRYVTENTFDAYTWQLVENKQKFIGQIMTSKSPVRSAEDCDEQALSYAEIKALATGNPLIKERMDLDVEVSRLKMLKSDFLSQRYNLEDRVIQYYPQQIKLLEERVAGFEQDAATAEANKPTEKDSFTMTVSDVQLAEKKNAGEAILAVTEKMTSSEAVPLGSYRGFVMEMAFDTVSRDFQCILTGKLQHRVTLGSDALGNITRIDNALDGLPAKLADCQDRLANTHIQLDNAKAEAAKPFAKEDTLQQKTERLAELDALLNMDDRSGEVIDDGLDEQEGGEIEPVKKDRGRER